MAISTLPNESKRFEELDALRGVAAVWVMLFHYLTRYGRLFESPGQPLSGVTFPDGVYGVELFFVISGFVIFMTLQSCRTSLDFIVARLSRLFPAYWAAMTVTFVVGSLWPLPGQHYSLIQVAVNATMLQSFVFVPSIDGVYWSLTIELCFYLVMLMLFVAGLLESIELIALGWLGLIGAAHVAALAGNNLPYRLSLLLVLEYGHLFIAGMTFYRARTRGYSALRVIILALCLAIAATAGIAHTLSVLIILLTFHLCIRNRLRALAHQPLLWLGAVSYPLYLMHQLLGYRVLYSLLHSGQSRAVAFICAVAVALLAAGLNTFLVERPGMRWLRHAYRRYRRREEFGDSLEAVIPASSSGG